MENKIKTRLKHVFLCGLILSLGWGCKELPKADSTIYISLEGKTMGTYYKIKYGDEQGRDLQNETDNLLKEVNAGLSTYIDTSSISIFNQSDTEYALSNTTKKDIHFKVNFLAASEVFERSMGAFDPTVMPLVNYWGFGYEEKKKVTAVDSIKVDSLLDRVGFQKITLVDQYLRKKHPEIELDFSGCAKGYAVDVLARLLEKQGIENYLVDIGGEVRAKGRNDQGEYWRIGINVPKEEADFNEIQAVVPLEDRALATSGNYRNFYESGGVKYSHTINPFSGYPERSTLLSASVFAKKCLYADAYATAFMVMGTEKAMKLANKLDDIEAYFIFRQPDGNMGVMYTDGIKKLFE